MLIAFTNTVEETQGTTYKSPNTGTREITTTSPSKQIVRKLTVEQAQEWQARQTLVSTQFLATTTT